MRYQDEFTVQLLEKWFEHCKGQSDFDKSDFLTLFHNFYDRDELEKIFASFDSSNDLVARMEQFQRMKDLRETQSTFASSAKLLELAMDDLRSKLAVFELCGESELYKIVRRATPKFETDRKIFEKALFANWPNGEQHCVLGDFVDDRWKYSDAKTYALFEAFYGAANSYDIQWFLGAPLIDTDVNFEHYLVLWGNKAELALTEQHLLVYQDTLG